MFDKLKFNNLVISNKKKIQRARTITIQKLIQKIKKLNSLLEKKSDDKNKERLRKNTENVAQLKQIKCIDIMRNVLLLEAKPSAVITNGRATPEEIAIALLAMNKIILDLVKVFKTELKLDDNDENKSWRTEIAETSKRRAKIERTEEKRRKRQELKEIKAVERKRTEWLKQNNNTETEAACEQVAKDESKVEKSLIAEEEGNDAGDVLDTKAKQTKKKAPRNKNGEMPPAKIVRFESFEHEESEKAMETEESIDDIRKSSITTKRKEESVNKSNREEESGAKEDLNTEDDNSVTHVVDPFFITETGESYLSTAVVKLGQESDEDEDDNGNYFVKRDNNNSRPQLQKQERQQHLRGQHQNKRGRQQEQYEQSRGRQDRDFKSTNSRETKNIQIKDNNRHPSWLAKEKFKPIINKFEGKKITFGDDVDTIVNTSSHKPIQIKDAPSETAVAAASSGLHPSWVAKQKLKPKIAAFEGKKITFDNDDD